MESLLCLRDNSALTSTSSATAAYQTRMPPGFVGHCDVNPVRNTRARGLQRIAVGLGLILIFKFGILWRDKTLAPIIVDTKKSRLTRHSVSVPIIYGTHRAEFVVTERVC
jgi:hypothetical protein